jgi:hypothetical protein
VLNIYFTNALTDTLMRCEHYSREVNRDHFVDASIDDGSLDLDYMEAVLTEDEEEIDRIERQAQAMGYGPRVACQTVANVSVQKLFCRESLS